MHEADVAEVRSWLRYAEEDLAAAEVLLAEKTLSPRQACWCAQPAAEKAIKSVLIFSGIRFPGRHDLDALRYLIPEGWEVKHAPSDLGDLTEWAVEARYPGDWPEATQAEAEVAVTKARFVVTSIAAGLRSRGLDSPAGEA